MFGVRCENNRLAFTGGSSNCDVGELRKGALGSRSCGGF